MVSKAATARTEPTAQSTPAQGAGQGLPGGKNGGETQATLKTYSITHLRRSQPNRVQINRINATDDADARRRAAQHFPDSTVLRICRARKTKPAPNSTDNPGTEDLPNARFIRGEFRPTDTEDEPTLRDLCS